MDSTDFYDNPLVSRYASPEMSSLWGPRRKFTTWRRIWVALAEAQAEIGLMAEDGVTPRITAAQIEEMRAGVNQLDLAAADRYEREVRHDVMAHNHAYGDVAPSARGIIHLGATSCDITDNADLILLREGLGLIRDRLVGLIDALGRFALNWRDQPTMGFTHFQPAQLTTVGKRACLWTQDLILDLSEIEHRLEKLAFRGIKGATGTQASFLALFNGDHAKVKRLEELVAQKMGFTTCYSVTGQTYSRKVDSQILDALSGIGQSLHKLGADVRLLAHRQEIDEPTEKGQIGSSAMPYKRNPMRSERMCGLARFLTSLTISAAHTAASQWLERTLDDSVNRRLTLPQAFLAADAALRLGLNVVNGLEVFPAIIHSNMASVLPYMATENLLMAAVAAGEDRQQAHEAIRRHSRAVSAEVRAGGQQNNLLDRLRSDPHFAKVDFGAALLPENFIGRAPHQVDEFLKAEIEPVRKRYPHLLGQGADIAR
ncbi:MAG: adenylosuccinate lyase [Planctomycetia bacterium]|nr:adenylosuccinate lyase [Planctomycetia bacterium]